jgi:hypothetical protein
MLNKLMMGVALSALALSGAMAQSNPSTSTTPSTPPAASSSPADSSKPSTDMNKPSTSGASSATSTPSSGTASSSTGAMAGEKKFVSTQNPDQWLASKFKGTDVVGADDKKIGDVSDILFDKEGKIEAFVISVGGFLGVGSKDVALAPTAFEVVKGKEGSSDKLKLAMSQEELKQAQNFEPYKAPQATTGAGSRPGGASSTMRPAGSPPASPSK